MVFRSRKTIFEEDDEVRDPSTSTPRDIKNISPKLVCKVVNHLNSASGSTLDDIKRYLIKTNEEFGKLPGRAVKNQIKLAMSKSIQEGRIARCNAAPRYRLTADTRSKRASRRPRRRTKMARRSRTRRRSARRLRGRRSLKNSRRGQRGKPRGRPRKVKARARKQMKKDAAVTKSSSTSWLWDRFMGGSSKPQKKATRRRRGKK